jgi:hypothetical protein
MEFKYEMKGEDGTALFEENVVLSRQFLGVGPWNVWDLRPDAPKNCKGCSSRAERVVCHGRGERCAGAARNEERVEIARDAIARRAARENERALDAVLQRAREIDREARENEGDAEEEGEGDAAEADAAADEEDLVSEKAADHSVVLSLVQ